MTILNFAITAALTQAVPEPASRRPPFRWSLVPEQRKLGAGKAHTKEHDENLNSLHILALL